MGPTPKTIGEQLVGELNRLTPGDEVTLRRIANQAEKLRDREPPAYLAIMSAIAAFRKQRESAESYVDRLLTAGAGNADSWGNASATLNRINNYVRAAEVSLEGVRRFPEDTELTINTLSLAPFLSRPAEIKSVVDARRKLKIRDDRAKESGDFMYDFVSQLKEDGNDVGEVMQVAMDLFETFDNGRFTTYETHIENIPLTENGNKELLTRIVIETADEVDEDRVFDLNEMLLNRISGEPYCFDSVESRFMVGFAVGG